MRKIHKTIILVLLVIIMLISCKTDKTNEEIIPEEKEKVTPLVYSALNNLNKENFLIEYGKLPDDSRFQIGDQTYFLYSNYEDDYPFVTEMVTKRELVMRDSIQIGVKENNIGGIIKPKFTVNQKRDSISLRGLRLLSNLDTFWIEGYHVSDVDELLFAPESLYEICFANCSFDVSIDELFHYVSLTKVKSIDLINCGVKDLNFLHNYENLNGFSLSFRDNEISDITVFRRFQGNYIEVLDLDNNLITDVTPLVGINFDILGLNNNRISDVSPLGNLRKGIVLEVGNNCILDYSSIKKHIDYYFSSSYYFVREIPKKHRNKVFRIDRDGHYNLYINGKKMDEKKFGKLTFINDSLYLWDDIIYLCEIEPVCNAVSLIRELGGTAEYNADLGILRCELNGDKYIFLDFCPYVICNGKVKKMEFDMRRMAGDVPYVSLRDMEKLLGFRMKEINNVYYYIYENGPTKLYMPGDIKIYSN